ncbi:hypothetical protein NEUTE2DRAFT_159049 [Neurospora tetrasperma FGSC 2509]|nr:hypothetical protein NEUTE2DRAFT_159049 [Neurospora tetrasperma FGSC 2509]
MSLFAGQDSRLFCRNPPSYLIRVVSTDPVTQISPTVILNRYMGCHVLFPLPGPSITHTHTHTYFLLALPTPCAATAATNPCLLTSSRRSTCRATSCPPYCVCSELQGSHLHPHDVHLAPRFLWGSSLYSSAYSILSQAEKDGPIMEVYKTPRLSALSSTPVVLCFHSLLHISASPFPSIYRILGPNSQYKLPSAHSYIWLAPPSFHKAKPLDCV